MRTTSQTRRSNRSNRGFGAMSPSQRRRIASEGGRSSHSGSRRNDRDYEDENLNGEGRYSSRRGFATMDPEEQRRIAAKGGRSSHGGWGRDYEDEDYEDENYRTSGRDTDYDEDYNEDFRTSGRGSDYDEDYGEEEEDYEVRGGNRRGFAAMDPEERRRIAAKGGRASHGGGRHPSSYRSR